LEGWGPFVLEDIKADSTELIDVWVEYLGSKQHFGSDHWVLFWEEEFAVEKTTFVRSISWTGNLDEEMSKILLIWLSVDTYDWVLLKSLCFFQNSWWDGCHLIVIVACVF
jgi:hypothetical protein